MVPNKRKLPHDTQATSPRPPRHLPDTFDREVKRLDGVVEHPYRDRNGASEFLLVQVQEQPITRRRRSFTKHVGQIQGPEIAHVAVVQKLLPWEKT